jgi:hypothetical protein
MTEPPAYVVALCEGGTCLPVKDLAEAEPREELVALLARLAERLRAVGAIGRVVVLDRRTGEVVAARRVWP